MKTHTNFHSDACRHTLMPFSGSSGLFHFLLKISERWFYIIDNEMTNITYHPYVIWTFFKNLEVLPPYIYIDIYRIIQNDCRCFNNLSYTIDLRYEYKYFFFYLIEQHSKLLWHTLQVLYMCTLCDSRNINTKIEFVPNCL